jgi:hypothetical protein
VSDQLDLGLPAERRLTRHHALQLILFRLDERGEELPRTSSTPNDAWLVGWQDDPGDPVFVSVGRRGYTPKPRAAVILATAFIHRQLELQLPEPNYIIPPDAKAG